MFGHDRKQPDDSITAFPLFPEGNERTPFAYAIYLLNKVSFCVADTCNQTSHTAVPCDCASWLVLPAASGPVYLACGQPANYAEH